MAVPHRIDPMTTRHKAFDACRFCGRLIDVVGASSRFRHLPMTALCVRESCSGPAIAVVGNIGINEAQLCVDHAPAEWTIPESEARALAGDR